MPDTKKDLKPLGDFSGDVTKLSQEQMLGQGGGVIFYEILDAEGNAREHMAMPCLLRDRPKVKAAMRKHAIATSEMAQMFSNPSMGMMMTEESMSDFSDKIAKSEEMDTDALLTIAYYSFKRTDAKLRDMDEEAGKLVVAEWMDELQLREILNIALGLNRFEGPSRRGAV